MIEYVLTAASDRAEIYLYIFMTFAVKFMMLYFHTISKSFLSREQQLL
jgi:hypothetical protein